MGKRLYIHNGFSLVETMIVLSIICMLMMIFPVQSYQRHIQQKQDLLFLYEFLLQAQHDAMYYHQRNDIKLYGNTGISTYSNITLTNLRMNDYQFHFNAKGHISKAFTITFTNANYKIVTQLGSGSFDIR